MFQILELAVELRKMGNTQASRVKSNSDTNIDTGQGDHRKDSKNNPFSPEIAIPRLSVEMEDNMKHVTLQYRTNGTEIIKIEGCSLRPDVANQMVEFGRKLHKFSCGDANYNPVLTLHLNNLISSIFCTGFVEISVERKVNPPFVTEAENESSIFLEDSGGSLNGLLSKSRDSIDNHVEQMAQNSTTIESIEKSVNDMLLEMNAILDENMENEADPEAMLDVSRVNSNEFDNIMSLLTDSIGELEKRCEVQSPSPQNNDEIKLSNVETGNEMAQNRTGGILLSALGSALSLAKKPWRSGEHERKRAKKNSALLAGEDTIYSNENMRLRKKSDHVYEEVVQSNQFGEKVWDLSSETTLSDFSDFESEKYLNISSTSTSVESGATSLTVGKGNCYQFLTCTNAIHNASPFDFQLKGRR